jgi:hypothetical protein
MPNKKGHDYGILLKHEIITSPQDDAYRNGYDNIDWGNKSQEKTTPGNDT